MTTLLKSPPAAPGNMWRPRDAAPARRHPVLREPGIRHPAGPSAAKPGAGSDPVLRGLMEQCLAALQRIERSLQCAAPDRRPPAAAGPIEPGAPGRPRFRLSADGDKLFLNDAYVTGKVQARLLWQILHVHLHSPQAEYDYARFKGAETLFENPKRTNFELRFRRIKEILRDMGAPVELKKLTHGRFTVITHKAYAMEAL